MSQPPPVSPPAACHLSIDRRVDADIVTLVLRGEIDMASAPALEHALNNIGHSSARRTVIDLAALDFIDSTGVHVLMRARDRALANRHELALTHIPAHARRLFELTGVNAHLNIQ